MSNIYILEPPTNGKVLLKTSVGDIDIELWSKECPKTCRNFIQLCLEGYYDGTIFHRLVKDFIVQGGDPSGTGMGGESIYGEPFKDEFHSRLKFNRRGMIGMANSGPNDNSSQFFFTLGSTPELDKKHTLFGKVSGNTVYNMIKLGETDVDKNERPLNPNKIFRTEILSNPFDDILPRETEGSKRRRERRDDEKKDRNRVTARATTDKKLLSFGHEEDDPEEEFKTGIKSSHDVIHDPSLSSVPVVQPEELKAPEVKEKKRKHHKKDKKKHKKKKKLLLLDSDKEEEEDKETEKKNKKLKEEEKKEVSRLNSRLEEARLQYQQLKKQVISDRKKGDVTSTNQSLTESKEMDEDVRKFLLEKESYKMKSQSILKKGTTSREEQTLAVLSRFRSKLLGGIKERGDGEEETITPSSTNDWMTHKLKSSKEDEGPVLAKDANTMGDNDWYDIHDPRSKIAKRRAATNK